MCSQMLSLMTINIFKLIEIWTMVIDNLPFIKAQTTPLENINLLHVYTEVTEANGI